MTPLDNADPKELGLAIRALSFFKIKKIKEKLICAEEHWLNLDYLCPVQLVFLVSTQRKWLG